MLLKLANLGPKIAVITGVHIEPNRFGYIGYNTESQTFSVILPRKLRLNPMGPEMFLLAQLPVH